MQVASYFSVVGTRTSGPKLDLPNSIFGRKAASSAEASKAPLPSFVSGYCGAAMTFL